MAVLGKRKLANSSVSKKEDSPSKHPFLTGNFAPVNQTCSLTPCTYSGKIPAELIGGQYVRNGSNPVSNEDLGRDAHWFDGDGMLSGVLFKRPHRADNSFTVAQPEFVCNYILTDLYLSATTTRSLRRPITPSIATLVNPLVSVFQLAWNILRSLLLVLLSHLPGSRYPIKRISVANTSIIWHDGRALATCESGPPMRVTLPRLDTVGWFDGSFDGEGERLDEGPPDGDVFGGKGLLSFMKEWTTAHPKVDPNNGDLILFHSTFVHPFVQYSIFPAWRPACRDRPLKPKLFNLPVPGIKSPKMMHDFGVSAQHTIIMDLPLTLDPLMSLRGKPPVTYDSSKPARFGIFPRRDPSHVKWFETSACCIFHTANTWDVPGDNGETQSVDMLACRMTSASVIFSAGNIPVSLPKEPLAMATDSLRDCQQRTQYGTQSTRYGKGPYLESKDKETSPLIPNTVETKQPLEDKGSFEDNEENQCRLYYYSFHMTDSNKCQISHQFALSAIPFEFPSVCDNLTMSETQYVFGCSTTSGSFNPTLGKTSKIDALVKFNVRELIRRGKQSCTQPVTGCVDTRSVVEVLDSTDESDVIQIFKTPNNVCAQEPRFVPANTGPDEDSGFLLSYMFDEGQLDSDGEAPPSAFSELWIIDAKSMKDVIAKVILPQRVPYGFHGHWFPWHHVENQCGVVKSRTKILEEEQKNSRVDSRYARATRYLSDRLIRAIGG